MKAVNVTIKRVRRIKWEMYLIAGRIAVDHDVTAAGWCVTAATASSSAGLYTSGRLVSCR